MGKGSHHMGKADACPPGPPYVLSSPRVKRQRSSPSLSRLQAVEGLTASSGLCCLPASQSAKAPPLPEAGVRGPRKGLCIHGHDDQEPLPPVAGLGVRLHGPPDHRVLGQHGPRPLQPAHGPPRPHAPALLSPIHSARGRLYFQPETGRSRQGEAGPLLGKRVEQPSCRPPASLCSATWRRVEGYD